jgi:hypothetical protein
MIKVLLGLLYKLLFVLWKGLWYYDMLLGFGRYREKGGWRKWEKNENEEKGMLKGVCVCVREREMGESEHVGDWLGNELKKSEKETSFFLKKQRKLLLKIKDTPTKHKSCFGGKPKTNTSSKQFYWYKHQFLSKQHK